MAYPLLTAFDSFVIRELQRRKQKIEYPTTRTPVQSPFVRVTSLKRDSTARQKYQFFHLGLHGSYNETGLDIFDLNYSANDVVGFGYDPSSGKRVSISSTNMQNPRQNAEGRHPIPGITNIEVHQRSVTDPINVDITWLCYNAAQLEFLRAHFQMYGTWIVVEWGTNYTTISQNFPKLKWSDTNGILNELTNIHKQGRSYVRSKYIAPSGGNYNIVQGAIVNANTTLRQDGVYECKTTLTSIASSIEGLINKTTAISTTQTTSDAPNSYNPSSVAEFFKEGSYFDYLVYKICIPKGYAVQLEKGASQVLSESGPSGIAASSTANPSLAAVRTNSFLSWNAFVLVIVPSLIAYIIKNGLQNAANSNLRSAAVITSVESGPTELRHGSDEPLVANNQFLRSVDFQTMVLKTSRALKEPGVDPNLFPGEQFSSPSGDVNTGVLSKGVWLNTAAILEAFNSTNNFKEAIQYLLNKMSGATNYLWNLELVHDEEKHRYMVVDRRTVDGASKESLTGKPYLFNEKTTGELLGLEFDAGYSKELQAQVLITSYAAAHKTDEVGTALTSVGNPAQSYTNVLNRGTLVDVLQAALDANPDIPPTDSNPSLQVTQTRGVRNTDRLLGESFLAEVASDVRATQAAPGQSNIDPQAQPAQSPDSVDTRPPQDLDTLRKAIGNQFDAALIPYIEPSPSIMQSQIMKDGQTSGKQNALTIPIPSEIQMNITMPGVAGFKMFDVFLVDKLPFIYREHGVFAIAEMSDTISKDGWTTTIRGIYYYCF